LFRSGMGVYVSGADLCGVDRGRGAGYAGWDKVEART
jgi:hypothetical protein